MKQFILVIVVTVLALLFSKWVFDAVMASNMPDWLKYVLLR